MSDIENRPEPVFLDEDTEPPLGVPLMATRHTLKSLGLAQSLFDQLRAGRVTEKQPETNHTTECSSHEHKA
ncbi:hypothetical protein D9M71_729880 [compost metagenome]|jgi:hypothetical protein